MRTKQQLIDEVMTQSCPYCDAKPGWACKAWGGHVYWNDPHKLRYTDKQRAELKEIEAS